MNVLSPINIVLLPEIANGNEDTKLYMASEHHTAVQTRKYCMTCCTGRILSMSTRELLRKGFKALPSEVKGCKEVGL